MSLSYAGAGKKTVMGTVVVAHMGIELVVVTPHHGEMIIVGMSDHEVHHRQVLIMSVNLVVEIAMIPTMILHLIVHRHVIVVSTLVLIITGLGHLMSGHGQTQQQGSVRHLHVLHKVRWIVKCSLPQLTSGTASGLLHLCACVS